MCVLKMSNGPYKMLVFTARMCLKCLSYTRAAGEEADLSCLPN